MKQKTFLLPAIALGASIAQLTSPSWCRLVLFVALAGLSNPLPAQVSQTTPNDSRKKSEEVVLLSAFNVTTDSDKGYRAANTVSATRIDTPIKDLPFAISAYTEQFIADIGARELPDIARFAPSTTNASREFGGGNSLFAIRGFESNPQRNGFNLSGNIYVDAVTVQRVEVVKGPATLLYGQLQPGGVINYITKRPHAKQELSVVQTAGSYNNFRTQADLNVPLIAKKLLFRVSGSWENGAEWVEKHHQRTSVIAPVVTWLITDNSSLTVDYQWFRRRENAQAFMQQNTTVPLTNLAIYPAARNPATGRSRFPVDYFGPFMPIVSRNFNISDPTDYRNSDNETMAAEYQIRFADGKWNARASYVGFVDNWHTVQHSRGDAQEILPAAIVATLSSDPAQYLRQITPLLDWQRDPVLASRRPRYQHNRNYLRTFQVEAAGKYEFSGVRWKPLFGVSEVHGFSKGLTSTIPTNLWSPDWDLRFPATFRDSFFPAEAFPAATYALSQPTNKAAYTIQQISALEDRLQFVGGARASSADSTNLSNGQRFKLSRTTPQLGAGYKLTRDINLYASYSESFQANNSLLRVRSVPTTPALPYVGSGYEVGVKTDLLNGRISTTLAAFRQKQDNYIFALNQITPTGATETTDFQNATVETEGVELDAVISPTDHWQIYLSASYNNPRYTVITVPDVAYLLGTQPESTAKRLLNVWTRYNFARGSLKGVWIAGGLNHTGDKQMVSNNPFLYWPNRTVWNATVGYDWKWHRSDMGASLAWKNITDVDDTPAVRARGLPSRLLFTLSVRH
jgi:iron complex outermembrane receptor protein